MSDFAVGDRVRLVGHWEFPDGLTGTVSEPTPFMRELRRGWRGHWIVERRRKGKTVCYFIRFDQTVDDGSGDGLYSGAVIEADCLELIDL